jgi:hypothetical protein
MLADRDTARQVEQIMRECSAALNESIRLVMEKCSEQEFKHYRKVIGDITGNIYLEVIRPLHLRFPDLEPDGLKVDKS